MSEHRLARFPMRRAETVSDRAGRYWRPDSWQIICAGPDGQFGPGGVVWGKDNPVADGSGADDMANFAVRSLRKP